MKITSVHITLDCDLVKASTRSQYQIMSNYLTLFISDWIKKLKIEMGCFNRVVFEESQNKDFAVEGDNALRVCLSEDFKSFDSFQSEDIVHDYFTKKYFEGFLKLDKKFGSELTVNLRALVENNFRDCCAYKKNIKTIGCPPKKYHLINLYYYNKFSLLVREIDKKQTINEEIIYSCQPDPFIVNYNVNKVDVRSDCILIFNKIREETAIYKFRTI